MRVMQNTDRGNIEHAIDQLREALREIGFATKEGDLRALGCITDALRCVADTADHLAMDLTDAWHSR